MTSEVHQHATMSDKTNASRFLLLRPRERCCAPPPATFPDGKVVHRAISILLLLLAAAACSSCHAFQRMITTGPPRTLQSVRRYSVLHVDRIPRPIIRATRWYSTFSADDIDNDNNDDDDAVSKNQVSAAAAANKLREEAACIRLEAEKLDWELTMSKLKALDDKVTKLQKPKQQSDPEKLKEAIDALEDQIQLLQQKLVGQRQRNESTTRSDGSRANQSRPFSSSSSSMPVARKLVATASSLGGTEKSPLVVVTTAESDRVIVSSSGEVMATVDPSLIMVSSHTVKSASSTNTKKKGAIANLDDDEILAGFDQSDLDLYIPVALEIEARLTNATADEKLEAFRTAPELQEHFQQKITQLLVEPMQGMQRLEDLKSQYLASSSTKEKEQLKRQIDALTISFEEDGPFQYSDSVYRETLELTEAARQAKLDAVSALPEILQTLYKKRHNLESDADLKLAVLLDHYEEQMQLLEQVKHVTPLSTQVRKEVVQAIESLPVVLQDHMAAVFGLNKDNYTVDKLIVELSKDDDDDDDDEGIWKWNPLKQMSLAAVEETTPDLPEYDDIDFVDRSRYVDEFYPAIARLEGQHPSLEAIDTFTRTVIDKQAFMMSSKAERVIGGYYIRGQNLVDLDNSGVQLMERLRGRMEQYQSLFGVDEQLEFFYIPDPSPLTDEEVELEFRNDPVILVTGKNATKFYNYASPWTKASVSAFGLFSMGVFALGVCGLDPALQQRLNAVSDVAAAGGAVDLSWLTDIVSQVVLSLCAIQVAHEAGHRFVAWRDKFEVGLPTILPSIQLGCLGTISPLKTPPPNLKSMFDFGITGPLVGMVASLAFFVQGLSMTATIDLNQSVLLPVVPTYLLRSSALGGGLIELFLGKSALMQGLSDDAVLPLHAFAIAGFVGILTNALALLPLGNTDGGRIALAMFGRRGTYIVKTFTTVLLCGAGLFGFDTSGVLLTYALFAISCQSELEAPARNEVEELDFVRGAFGILTAIVCALALLPMQ